MSGELPYWSWQGGLEEFVGYLVRRVDYGGAEDLPVATESDIQSLLARIKAEPGGSTSLRQALEELDVPAAHVVDEELLNKLRVARDALIEVIATIETEVGGDAQRDVGAIAHTKLSPARSFHQVINDDAGPLPDRDKAAAYDPTRDRERPESRTEHESDDTPPR
ncbi:hypothetical protein LWF01_02665 [Saxibacter everestensis]|uniref:Uncharacterized protein n=1 Tax=Saxibacter everestensis TaxID=2909229 RepID=A0ABY8QUL1_9MICO|nr:hypothetical protein LWF01_02665 [Brevibacteriaceae bacterium ZFBP1038]